MLLMAVVNRRSGMTHGNAKILQSMVLHPWKGLQIARSFAGNIGQILSLPKSKVKQKMTEFSNRFKSVLTPEQRSIWDQYAGTLGSAVDREASDNVANSKNVIPRHRRALQSGINAYVAANINGFLAGMTTPLDVPPFGEAVPPPPITVAITTYDALTGLATVTWTDPVLVDTPISSKVRLWAMVQAGKGKVHTQLVSHTAIPGGTTTFDKLNGGKGWGSPVIKLNQIGKGTLRVQMDTIVQRAADEAPLIGPGSNVAEFKIAKP